MRRRVIRHGAGLGIPPYGTVRAVRENDHRSVRAVRSWRAIRIEQRLSGLRIARLPLIDDQGCGSRAHTADTVVQLVEPRRNRLPIVEALEVAAQPLPGSVETDGLAALCVDGSVESCIRPSWCGDLRNAEKGCQRGERTIEAVVATSLDSRAAVVDQLPIWIEARIGADEEPVAVTERVFDGGLVLVTLDSLQVVPAESPQVGRIVESGRGVCVCDVVTELSDVVGAQAGIGRRRQAEMVANVVGEIADIGVRVYRVGSAWRVSDMYLHIGRARIRGVDDVQKHAVAAQELLAAVEPQIGGQLHVLPQLIDDMRGDMAVGSDVDTHPDHCDRAARSVRVSAYVVCRGGIRTCRDQRGAAVLRWVVPI